MSQNKKPATFSAAAVAAAISRKLRRDGFPMQPKEGGPGCGAYRVGYSTLVSVDYSTGGRYHQQAYQQLREMRQKLKEWVVAQGYTLHGDAGIYIECERS